MSIAYMNAVWSSSTTKGSKRLVLLALADIANDQGIAWPSLSTLATKCNLDRRYVINIIASLEESGFISKQVRRATEMKNYSNVYKINLEKVVNDNTLPDKKVVNRSSPGSEQEDTTSSEQEFTRVVNRSSPEPSLTNNKPPTNPGDACKFYLENFGQLTPFISDEIGGFIDDYTEEWVVDAMKEAVRNKVRKTNYVKAILERWAENGKSTEKRPTNNKPVSVNQDGSANV